MHRQTHGRNLEKGTSLFFVVISIALGLMTATASAVEIVWDGWRNEFGIKFRTGAKLYPATATIPALRFDYVELKNESQEEMQYSLQVTPASGQKHSWSGALKAGKETRWNVAKNDPTISVIVSGAPSNSGTKAESFETPGIALFMAANLYDKRAYQKGMQCNDLIIKACNVAGISVTKKSTNEWFAEGMGSGFRQIAGGNSGMNLGDLAENFARGKIKIPIGSVIVAEGHAGIVSGVISVNGRSQLITYDANNEVGWTVSVMTGAASKDDQIASVAFLGHRVGEHVTRLQWGSERRVKVFEPLAVKPR